MNLKNVLLFKLFQTILKNFLDIPKWGYEQRFYIKYFFSAFSIFSLKGL